jgi:hypothetical protein
MSRIFFRGPRKSLECGYIAFIGGTDTYGKFIEHPYPMLCESELGEVCVNLGVVNGGVDAFVHDPTLMALCSDAAVTVVQMIGAQNLSNRFYKVHPRRNDRFLAASSVMKVLFNDVDFTEFSFNRHMLGALYKHAPDRFEILRNELQEAWVARMRSMLTQIGPNSVLLWMSNEQLTDDPWNEKPQPFKSDPLFVTRSMVETLRPLAREVVEVTPSAEAFARGTEGMVFPFLNSTVANEQLGVAMHEETAARLVPTLRTLLDSD